MTDDHWIELDRIINAISEEADNLTELGYALHARRIEDVLGDIEDIMEDEE